jgi:hypothetical protein
MIQPACMVDVLTTPFSRRKRAPHASAVRLERWRARCSSDVGGFSMANALVVAPPSMITLTDVRGRDATPASGVRRSARPRYLYGDGSPFPYETDFVETIGRAVECGIALMRSQDSITRAVNAAADVERACGSERTNLQALADGMSRVLVAAQTSYSDRVARATAGIVATSRKTIDQELEALEKQRELELRDTATKLKDARVEAARALETFLGKEDLPGSEVCLRLTLHDEEYRAEALVLTPFGVHAVFALDVPRTHVWARARRVGDLEGRLEVQVPQEAGWFSKRVEVQPLRLDKLFVHSIAVTPERSVLTLRKAHGGVGGPGYKLELARDSSAVVFRAVPTDGAETSSVPCELSAEDSSKVWTLWRRILATSADLGDARRAMKSAYIDGTPLMEHLQPETVVRRMVQTLAPIVKDISRRSCSPGELVLRRDVRAWRREEIYVTKAELDDRVQSLPYALRGVFEPLALSSTVRSPRARARLESMSSRIELDDADIVSE